jgi:hypothetical protein
VVVNVVCFYRALWRRPKMWVEKKRKKRKK